MILRPDRLDVGIMGWWWEGMGLEGSPESEIFPGIAPLPNERVILKHRYSAFLETVLRRLKIEDLVVVGYVVNLPPRVPISGIIGCSSSLIERAPSTRRCNLRFGFAFITRAGEIIQGLRK